MRRGVPNKGGTHTPVQATHSFRTINLAKEVKGPRISAGVLEVPPF